MAVPLSMVVYNAPYGMDMTQTRIAAKGLMEFDSGQSYSTGGLLPNWDSSTGTLGMLQDQSGQDVLLATYTQPTISNITAVTVTGTTCLFATINPPNQGQFVTLGGFSNAKSVPFNGITAQVASNAAGQFFTATITTTATTVTDNGQAVTVIGPDDMEIESVSGSGYVYRYNKANATVQVFEVPASSGLNSAAQLTELAATTMPVSLSQDTVQFRASWVRQ